MAYALTAGVLGLGYGKGTARLIVGAFLVTLAATLESLELVVPGRSAEPVRFGAGLLGTAFGLSGAVFVDLLLFAQYRLGSTESGAWARTRDLSVPIPRDGDSRSVMPTADQLR